MTTEAAAGSPFETISMTGFGKAVQEDQALMLEVEVRSVNSRFLDFNFKLPREYSCFEHELRRIISASVKRGRIDLYVSRKAAGAQACRVDFHRGLFDAYLQLYRSLASEFRCLDNQALQGFIKDLLMRREVAECVEECADPEAEKPLLFAAVEGALRALGEMRRHEGLELGKDISANVERLGDLCREIGCKTRLAPEELKKRLIERLSKLAPEIQIDPARLAMEAALAAERVDVSEELVRLESHLGQLKNALRTPPNGRVMEFIVQECGREVNTIASKAQQADVQGRVVECKSCLERIREQLQNVE